jgi:hypothetical protein
VTPGALKEVDARLSACVQGLCGATRRWVGAPGTGEKLDRTVYSQRTQRTPKVRNSLVFTASETEME